MEVNIDGFKPPIKEVKTEPNRQESLEKQLDTLDPNRKDHQVYAKFLKQLYDPKRYEPIEKELIEKKNVRYQPKSALIGNLTKVPFVDFWGIYDYKPIIEAVEEVPDNFNVFPSIQEVFKQSEGKSNQQIITEVAKVITDKTNIPIFFEEPYYEDTIGLKLSILEDGNICQKTISHKDRGLHTLIYQGSPKIRSDIEEQGRYDDIDPNHPIGDAIIINKLFTDDSQAIQTCVHELGHIDEEKFILPEKKNDERLKDKSFMNTEIISSLYGFKSALLMAEYNPDLALQMMISPVAIYNWALTGTVAP